MTFIGIDLHTNRFTCCYRDGHSPPDGKRTETFEISMLGLADFYKTLNKETYVLLEATITTFSFARLIQPLVKEVIVANTYELKQISLGRNKTDKIDADKLCRILKMQVLSGESTISPVTIPPVEIQELRGMFCTCRLLKKQTVQIKNRIHSLLKEKLHGFTQEHIFGKGSRKSLRAMEGDPVLSFQINELFETLEYMEAKIEVFEGKIKERAEPFMREINILTSMKGVSVFIAIAIIADAITVDRFKNSKAFTSYLRSAPRVESSNTTKGNKGTNKMGRKLAATLLTQILNHALDGSPKLEKWYNRLTQYKKAGSVRTGLRRRVFAEIYQMLKKGEYHYGRDPKKHEEKMGQYERFFEKRKNLLKSA